MRLLRAFTLIELLVVIAIIGLLAGMLIVVIGPIMESAKSAVTIQRMNDSLMGLSQKGQQEGMTAFVLQQECSKGYNDVVDKMVGGVFTYKTDPLDASGIAQIINTDAAFLNGGFPITVSDYLDVSTTDLRKYHFPYPWGKKHGSASGVVSSLWPEIASSAAAVTVVGALYQPDRHDLRDINPRKTRELLRAAETIPRDRLFKDYMTDRSPKQNWNDRWGNPLVASFAFFQPPLDPSPPTGTTPSNDQGRREALKLYQYERRFYIAIGAAGVRVDITAPNSAATPSGSAPSIADLKDPSDGTWSSATGNLVQLWKEITDICEYDRPFDELSFDNPPWAGVKRAKMYQAGKKFLSFLSSPLEF
jgi:prepilin-type N-terminal cleavage/methylation domain-containing protein